ncbi:helix-turn-helix transcriptional regulator [Sulfitobacter geojensis]|uniref:helix-turn-helix transcriptional regulator n=1 Tax=Sulfitobacter geojensis TaxID=1342299 RepID=UPI003B8D34A9
MCKKASSDSTIRPPYIRERQIEKRFGVSRGTQYRLRLRGIFPPGIRLGPRAVIYSEPEIIEALANLASGSINVNLDG